jgi:hypothetical protein
MKALSLAVLLSFFAFSTYAAPVCGEVFKSASLPPLDSKKSWGEQIFHSELGRMEVFFDRTEGMTPNQMIDLILSDDGRVVFFRLQSLSRLFDDRGSAFFGEFRAVFKSGEDAIGAVDLAKNLKKTAETLGDAELVAFFAKQESDARVELTQTLETLGLLRSHRVAIAKWKQALSADRSVWGSGPEDKVYLISSMMEYAKDLQKKSEKLKFDHDDIEQGLHELRRRIRWVTISIQALDGLVAYSEAAPMAPKVSEWFAEILKINPDVLNSKYVKLSEPRVPNPILVPRKEFALLSQIVTSIGTKKDNAEAQLYVRLALEKMGASPARKAALQAKLLELQKAEVVDHRALSVEYQNRLNETELLKQFAKNLKFLNL